MSFDIRLEIDVGNGNMRSVDDIGNVTYNVSPMFYAALGEGGLRGLHQKQANDVIAPLAKAIADMEARPEFYRAMNPKNGWGNYEGALKILQNLLAAATECPNTIVSIS